MQRRGDFRQGQRLDERMKEIHLFILPDDCRSLNATLARDMSRISEDTAARQLFNDAERDNFLKDIEEIQARLARDRSGQFGGGD